MTGLQTGTDGITSVACCARSRYNGSCRTVHNDIIDPSGRCVTCELVRVGLYSLGVYVTLRVHFATVFHFVGV